MTTTSDHPESIAGVDLATYAEISVAVLRADPETVAAAFGISPWGWEQARSGWLRRIAEDDAVREAYAEHYRSARLRVRGADY